MPIVAKVIFGIFWGAAGGASFYGTYPKCKTFIMYLISILEKYRR